ncbi:hypothetical protein GN958_ATG18579 [Phytophthora infestans]|uniref:Uncharacterized protein n=1 Tax=Phytophthora infestans TaxID=4787 RepID=A0A8S9U009_PHYIN|nr:hypothetical protein GN958_ATG18579 [Phytophthora infestans]
MASMDYERVKESIKSTVDERLLKALCTYHWSGVLPDAVTDVRIRSKAQAIVEHVTNGTLPDIDQRFGDKVRFNSSETDASVRALQYFMLCSQLIDKHGLVTCFDHQCGQNKICKLFIESLTPNELKRMLKLLFVSKQQIHGVTNSSFTT